MRGHPDQAADEVRAACKALCDPFGNDPRRLFGHLREEQSRYEGWGIIDWSQLEPAGALRETPAPKKKKTAMIRYGINDIRLFHENGVRFLRHF